MSSFEPSSLSVTCETIETTPALGAATPRRGLATTRTTKNEGAMDNDTQTRGRIAPNDPRHGSTRGFHAGCREACCRAAIARYEKENRYRRHVGNPRSVDAKGTQRRIQALMAIGYTSEDLRLELGWSHRNGILRILNGQKGKPCRYVEFATYNVIHELYERLHMSLPKMTGYRRRAKTLAVRKGYVPPLGWDCIDTDPEPPVVREMPEKFILDDVKIRRVLDGIAQDCNPAERAAVIEAWTGSIVDLERVTGWNVHRFINKREAA